MAHMESLENQNVIYLHTNCTFFKLVLESATEYDRLTDPCSTSCDTFCNVADRRKIASNVERILLKDYKYSNPSIEFIRFVV